MTDTHDSALPSDALDNSPATVRLAGQEFQFREPGQRRGRALLLLEQGIVPPEVDPVALRDGGDAALKAIDPGLLIGMIDAAQDFVHDALGVDAATRQQLEDGSSPAEIMAAFSAISEVLARPFAGLRARRESMACSAPEPAATPATPNGETPPSP